MGSLIINILPFTLLCVISLRNDRVASVAEIRGEPSYVNFRKVYFSSSDRSMSSK